MQVDQFLESPLELSPLHTLLVALCGISIARYSSSGEELFCTRAVDSLWLEAGAVGSLAGWGGCTGCGVGSEA
jgi:hypothetical protein